MIVAVSWGSRIVHELLPKLGVRHDGKPCYESETACGKPAEGMLVSRKPLSCNACVAERHRRRGHDTLSFGQ